MESDTRVDEQAPSTASGPDAPQDAPATTATPSAEPSDVGPGAAAWGAPPGAWGQPTGPWSAAPGPWGPPPGQWGGPSGPWGPPPGQWSGAAPSGGAGEGATSGFWRRASTAWIVAGILGLVVIGLSWALATTHDHVVRVVLPGRGATVPGFGPFGRGAAGQGGAGGTAAAGSSVVGTVSNVAQGSFTVTSSSGATITVNEQSSTQYYSGRTAASASAVVNGARVAVRGTRNGSVVTANIVIVLPAGGFGFGAGPGA
jgi:Domain of unknown function (DUF5666)